MEENIMRFTLDYDQYVALARRRQQRDVFF